MLFEIEGKRDNRGVLYPFEFKKHNFKPERFFFVKDVPEGDVRGEHAHKETDQLLFCLNGVIEVTLFDGSNTETFLIQEGEYVFEKRMTWTTLKFLKAGSILMVASSKEYDPADYIRDYETFLSSI
jgi:dTDP-4-dehydrorhamnose 3,5-epimerase-like enzyme